MTTTQETNTPSQGSSQQAAPGSWSSTATALARIMASPNFSPGDLAQLRRMDPEKRDAPAFWRLMAQYNLFRNEETERKWALIISGIALMTPRNSSDTNIQTAHDGQRPVGRALFQGDDLQATTAFYKEQRLNRLLTARGPMLETLLRRMFRMMARAGITFDWREMTTLILNNGYSEPAAEQVRRRIARTYYQAERHQGQQDKTLTKPREK